MPLKKGDSRKTIGENIAEFHTGKTYKRARRKFGKARANQMAVAAAYRAAGRSTTPTAADQMHPLMRENEFHRPR